VGRSYTSLHFLTETAPDQPQKALADLALLSLLL